MRTESPPPGVPVHYPPPPLSRPDAPLAKIVVPFTSVHPDTRSALARYGTRVEYVDVTPVGAYWRLFRDLWAAGSDFILIEHDIVPTPRTIEHFDECPQSWCCCSYKWYWKPAYHWIPDHSAKVLNSSLGCNRFRAEFLKACPDLGSDEVLARFDPPISLPVPYYLLDSIVLAVAMGRRWAWCQHERVEHRRNL